jgi:hypothetical protein
MYFLKKLNDISPYGHNKKISKEAAEIVRPISDSSFYNYRVHSTSSLGHHRQYRIQRNKDVSQWVGAPFFQCRPTMPIY